MRATRGRSIRYHLPSQRTSFHCSACYELEGTSRHRSAYYHRDRRQQVLTYCGNVIIDYPTVPGMRHNRTVTWWVAATGNVDRKSKAGVRNLDECSHGTHIVNTRGSNKYELRLTFYTRVSHSQGLQHVLFGPILLRKEGFVPTC